MTSATPAPPACGALLTTHQVEMNTRPRLYARLKRYATKRFVCFIRNLQNKPLSESHGKRRWASNFNIMQGIHMVKSTAEWQLYEIRLYDVALMYSLHRDRRPLGMRNAQVLCVCLTLRSHRRGCRLRCFILASQNFLIGRETRCPCAFHRKVAKLK